MPAKQSAGLLIYRKREALEVLLVHPGGPLWAKKDIGAWTLPKGEVNENEDLLAAAKREFQEETGFTPTGPFHSLGTVKQKNGKLVSAWAFEGDCDCTCAFAQAEKSAEQQQRTIENLLNRILPLLLGIGGFPPGSVG